MIVRPMCTSVIAALLGSIGPIGLVRGLPTFAAEPRSASQPPGDNLAVFAEVSTSYVSGHEQLEAIQDDVDPRDSGDHSHGCYGNWPRTGTQWVQYDWPAPIRTGEVDVYWWDDHRGVRLPVACRLLYWDGREWKPVPNAQGLGVEPHRYNRTRFDLIETTRLRLEFDSQPKFSTGIIEWKVYDAGGSPAFAPRVRAGPDRVVVPPAATHLAAQLRGRSDGRRWSVCSGPGAVQFADPANPVTTASFQTPGDYVLTFCAWSAGGTSCAPVRVRVEPPPTPRELGEVPVGQWSCDSPFWRPRLRAQIVGWIPHCVAMLSKPDLKEGGLENFVRAARKHAEGLVEPHIGPPWANAYVLNTLEAMCRAVQLAPAGDAELQATQSVLRATIEQWVPIVLGAQEPDGYLQTRFTLGVPSEHGRPPPRWTRVGDHEGYVAGYFIDAAIAHYEMSGGQDRRMLDAACRLADCWDAHIGPPPKQAWYDGHQALEMSLVRLGRLLQTMGRASQADRYFRLAKFLMDCRRNGSEYDQSHVPVTQQYEVVGHAVRATYLYAAMADVAGIFRDPEYHSAVRSLWESFVHRKYYLTGGVGSGETSEGFGAEFSLPNHSYCESCAACGAIFWHHRMRRTYGEARFADVLEDTLYNALLGATDLPGKNFTYTNPLEQDHARYPWHGCPCCVGNIPRVLLALPTWMYTTEPDGIRVDLYVGSRVRVTPDVEIVQRTAYPWHEAVEIEVCPRSSREWTLRLRVPDRCPSPLYTVYPVVRGLRAASVNGTPIPIPTSGYLEVRRAWRSGDVVRLELPLDVQRVRCDERVQANRGRVALRRGPLIYCLESVDQSLDSALPAGGTLTAEWVPELLEGVVVVHGHWANGSPLTAIPYYARNNRGGRSMVWIPETGREPGTVHRIVPPRQWFFSKCMYYAGIPILAHEIVSDEALRVAYRRLARMLDSIPDVTRRLERAGAELHIIGRTQVTTDLPEFRDQKGRPLRKEHGATLDDRTRGMGGLLASCGEENLLQLPDDRYRGRDICVHEFAHTIYQYGLTAEWRRSWEEQFRASLARGRWRGSYAASNPHEFFAELCMWYFGTHGDLGMPDPKPSPGPEGLKAYDPEAFARLDALFGGGCAN